MKSSLEIVLMIVLAIPAVAQQIDSTEGADLDPQGGAPAMLLGQSVRHGLAADAGNPNFISGGISVTQLFTDNANLTPNGSVSDIGYAIQPNLMLSHLTPRLSYDFGVNAGFVMNRTLSERNQATQSATFDVSYGLTQFVRLRLSDSFTNSTGLWNGTGTGTNLDTGPGIGAVQQGNSSLQTYGSFRENNALAELSDQFTPSSSAGIRASHSYTWFPSSATDPLVGSLYGGSVYSAEAFYNQQFTQRNWGGIIARAQRFDINSVVGRTDAASLLFLYGFNFRPNVSLSFFGGPELSINDAPKGVAVTVGPFSRRMWTPAAGAVFSAHSRTAGVAATYTHQISGGGGLLSAVTLDSVDTEAYRQIGRHFRLGPSFTYALSTPVVTSSPLRIFSSRAQLSYHVGNVTLSGAYGRDDRTLVTTNVNASANNVWVSFSYSFLRPLGK